MLTKIFKSSFLPKQKSIFGYSIVFFSIVLILNGCSTYENVTGYFNTYYNTKKLFTEAITEIEKAPQKDRDTNYFAMYSVPKGASDKLDKVIEKCNKIIQLYPLSGWVENSLLMMAQSYAYQGETETAIRKLNEFLETFPNSEKSLEINFLKLKTLYHAKKEDEVLQSIKESISYAQTEDNQDVLLELLILEAQIYYDREEYNIAIEKYGDALKIEGDDKLLAIVHYQLGQCYEHQNEFDKAAQSYINVSDYDVDPTREFKSRLKHGIMLSKAKQYDKALVEFETLKGEKLKPEEKGFVELEYANTFLAMDDTAKAFESYKTIDSLYKRTDASAQAQYQRGLLFEKKYYNFRLARTYYERAKNEFPSSHIAPIANRKFANLTNYFKYYENLTKYDSLLQLAYKNDSLKGSVDSSKKSDEVKISISDSGKSQIDSTRHIVAIKETENEKVKSEVAENYTVATESHLEKDTLSRELVTRTEPLPHDTNALITTGEEKTYIVGTWEKDRECLWNIAKKENVYGNGSMWIKIWHFNRDIIKDPNVIRPKWIIKIPIEKDTVRGRESKKPKSYGKRAAPLDMDLNVEVDTIIHPNDSLKAVQIQSEKTTPGSQYITTKEDSTIQAPSNLQDVLKSEPRKLQDSLKAKGKMENPAAVKPSDTSKSNAKTALQTAPFKLSPDSVASLIAATQFELAALLFLEMDLPDSALSWYESIIRNYPSSILVPRAYYAMAEIYRLKNDTINVDSLYKIILDRYDKTEYATQVKKIMGLEVNSSDTNQADSTYNEAMVLLQSGEIKSALNKFDHIVKITPVSALSPKALYTMGWILENIVLDNDSATTVYKKLMKEYPSSIYSTEVKSKVAVRDDPKSLQQFVKIKEIQPVAKTETPKKQQQVNEQDAGKELQDIQQPQRGRNQQIDLNQEEPEDDEELPPDEEEEDDDGGGS